MGRTGLCIALLFLAVKGAVAYPTLHVEGEAQLGQPTSLRCTCNESILLKDPEGTALSCTSTSNCLSNRPGYISLDRDKSEGETYVAVINETRTGDEGEWRCQCGNQEAKATLRIQRTTSMDLTTPEPIRAAANPTLNVDDSPILGQPTSLRCTCNESITLEDPEGTDVLSCTSTSSCLSNRPGYISLDRDKSEGETYVAVINETRTGDEGEWRCQCGNQEVKTKLRILRNVQQMTYSNSCFCFYPSFLLLIFVLLLVCLT
ncbi:uncharacterized protein LOC124285422 [Haliotis rubra]|uniref:uncharacterized protein LOC124285422 n=1 Tax=Haliotis rubra TaxID=36100 RepID=UPI001EE507FE|nr:uncharacterized protein LOC124285422 [Haliotis rubra]